MDGLKYKMHALNSWINVWVAGKTVWTPCYSARSSRWWLLSRV